MPNNPGRIEGDYSIGDKEEIRYADPPAGFGAAKRSSFTAYRKYVLVVAAVIIVLALFVIFRL